MAGTLKRNKDTDQWFNTSAFTLGPQATFGNAGRNIVRGPGINDWSMNFFKNTKIRWPRTEGANIQFGAEFYKLFNHPQFESVGSVFGNANFGHVLSARDPRIVQLRLKVSH